jgi:hypothetical protein
MEVHHPHHLSHKKVWKEYFWEFFMLFLAVFCGSLAELQLEHYIENQREKKYVVQIQQDLLASSKEQNLNSVEKIAVFSLLKTILSPAELLRVELFENNKGQKLSAASMISAALELEPWLKPYQIKKSDDNDLVNGLLAGESDIFNNILFENWDAIISSEEVLKNVPTFYQSVEKYALFSKNPKPINALKYVFIDREIGFVSVSQLCYHPCMTEFEQYKDLRKAIKNVSDLHSASPETLSFLSIKPFKTKETGLSKFLKNQSLLTKEEVVSLMQFMEIIREDFFKVLTVSESDN